MKALKKYQLLCGAAAGFINGLLGGGGGIIAVILLKKVLKLPQQNAHANALAIMLPTTIVSAILYSFNGVYSASVYPITLGVIVGGLSGSLLLGKLRGKTLEIIFLCVTIFSAIRMVI